MTRTLGLLLLSSFLCLACGDDGDAAPNGADAAVLEQSDVFLDSASLAGMMSDANLQIIDVRSQGDYESAHITSAIHLDASRLRATVDGIGGQVTDLATSQGVFDEAGLVTNSKVVLYGDSTDTAVTRVYWTLLYYGHESVSILDGGISTWTGATESGASTASASGYTVTAADEMLRVDAEWVNSHLDDPTVVLIDARSSAEYASGHIPGAVSVDWPRNLSGGSLLPIEQVRALYEAVKDGDTVVTYCQSGSRAAVAYAVARWLSFADVRLYDGSWAEWGSRQDLPKEQ